MAMLVKYQMGPWLFSAGIDGGYGWYDSSRRILINDFATSASASPSAWNAGLDGRVSYQIPFERWYLRPNLDLHLMGVGSEGYRETGPSHFNLAVQSESDLAFVTNASLEAGTRIDLGPDGVLKPYISLGVSGIAGVDNWAATARFTDASVSTRGFRAATPIPTVLGKVALGLDLLGNGDWDLKVQYTGDFSDNYASNTGLIRASFKF
jgi:outer membrane autotransporter protein